MVKCAACGKFLSAKGGATCGNFACHNRYHLACLPDAAPTGSDWLCPECRSRLPKGDNSATPVRGLGPVTAAAVVATPDQGAANKSPVRVTHTQNALSKFTDSKEVPRTGSDPATDGEPSPDTQLSLRDEIRLFRSELREVRDEMREFRREMAGLHSTVGICTERVDHLEARVEALESKQSVAMPDGKVSQLENLVSQLRLELNDREQDLFSSDLEIANIPEIPGENIVHTVGLVAAKLGLTVEERDIVFAQRVGQRVEREGRAAGATSPAAAAAARGRRIVVRLTRRSLRDGLLQSARVRRGATTADLGLPTPPRRFYLNERLTRTNKHLFYRVREAAGQLGWRYTWTKYGRILTRQGDGKPTHCIRTEEDLSRVFGGDVSAEKVV
ncbi:hypothetical protein HF086_013815 [Spodoptera exigua]|uniref:FP protein C-terminal domain-containing protein n=2 Tax=Spodoptera exigua TaxID=7107 RepID=A0A922MM25_SPOEX|nr:hypothetical protein HF086_013815 [Spodoptera exigua]